MAWFRRTGQTWKLVIFSLACWAGLGPYCGGMKLASFDPGGLEHCPICRDTGDVRPVDPPLFSSFRRM